MRWEPACPAVQVSCLKQTCTSLGEEEIPTGKICDGKARKFDALREAAQEGKSLAFTASSGPLIAGWYTRKGSCFQERVEIEQILLAAFGALMVVRFGEE